ncbi:MAG TPA: hypothetical protein VH165_21520, partial [Kofleriaceae bacterium]|nr:hypothetical protein [Kofleriaceae bacterium]
EPDVKASVRLKRNDDKADRDKADRDKADRDKADRKDDEPRSRLRFWQRGDGDPSDGDGSDK